MYQQPPKLLSYLKSKVYLAHQNLDIERKVIKNIISLLFKLTVTVLISKAN